MSLRQISLSILFWNKKNCLFCLSEIQKYYIYTYLLFVFLDEKLLISNYTEYTNIILQLLQPNSNLLQ